MIEDGLLVARSVNAFVAKRKTEDDITAKVANQVIVAIQEVGCGVASDGDIRCVEGILASAFIMASDELLTIKVAITLPIGSALTVCNRRAEDGYAVFVDWGRYVVDHILHIDGDGISARVLIDVLHALSLLDFSQHISCCSTLKALDGVGIVVVECEVHCLVNPLLRGSFHECHLTLEDAVSFVRDGGIACSDVASNVHRDRKNRDCLVSRIDCDASHTVLRDRERRFTFDIETAATFIRKRHRFAINFARKCESACFETGKGFIEVASKRFESHILCISAERKACEFERFFRPSSAFVLFHPHRADVCHSEDSLVGDEDVAALVRIDIVGLQDVSQVAVIAFAAYVRTRSGLSASPSLLSLEGIECGAIVRMIARAVNVEAIAMFRIEFGHLEGTHFCIICEDIILRSRLYGEVSQVVRGGIVVASSVNAIRVGLLHYSESGPSRSASAVFDDNRLVCRDDVACACCRGDIVPAIAVRVCSSSLMPASIIACLAEIEVHLLHQGQLLVRSFHARHLLHLHAIEIDHDA